MISDLSRILTVLLTFLTLHSLHAQEWEFIKEKDGIKIYTLSHENSPVKSYKCETYIQTRMDILSEIIENVEDSKEFDKNIKEIEVLEHIEDSLIRYYLLYGVQWPFDKRDLYVEARISQDTVTGKRIISSTTAEGVIPEKQGIVRIKDYWQKWILEPVSGGKIHVISEGSVDPGGSIPAWIVNMVLTDTPLKTLRKIREKATLEK